MHIMRIIEVGWALRLLVCAGAPILARHACATEYSVIYNFDQSSQFTGLIAGPAGSVYGYHDTAIAGVTGAVFKLTPPLVAGAAWTYSIVYNFHDNAGHTGEGTNVSGLALDKTGSLYGTTGFGGATSFGTVFKLTPPAAGQTSWTRTTLFDRFDYTVNGAYPSGDIYINSSGLLFGTTMGGAAGCFTCGTVYLLSPPSAGSGRWKFTVLRAFRQEEAQNPSGLTIGPDGALYGAADTLWRLTPSTLGKAPWDLKILAFGTYNQGTGAGPNRPVLDRSLNLFGSAYDGGSNDPGERYGSGVVYRLTSPEAGRTAWTQTILYDFSGPDGDRPVAALTEDTHGVLYGVTSEGGVPVGGCDGSGCGTAFKLTSREGGTTYPWNRITLHSFTGMPDGAYPTSSLLKTVLPDGRLALFGVTYAGGTSNGGVVFRIIP